MHYELKGNSARIFLYEEMNLFYNTTAESIIKYLHEYDFNICKILLITEVSFFQLCTLPITYY